MRVLTAVLAALASSCLLAFLGACSSAGHPDRIYGAQHGRMGASLAVLGWNMAVSNLRWDADYVLINVDAAVTEAGKTHAKPGDIRFGLYGALAHPMEITGIGSCDHAMSTVHDLPAGPLVATPDRLTGTVCLGPLTDRSAVRGVYTYSPKDRIPDTAAAYPAAFPVGMLPSNENDTGLAIKTTSVSAWRADGTALTKASLGDAAVFTGAGYMLLGLTADAVAVRYRDESTARGGPMMVVTAPTLPGPGLNPGCAAYGAAVLILPVASLDAVHVTASLCTQGEISQAVLYATVAVVGTHAALWTDRD